ncbi:MAG TPA: ABC transporter ATP-binding protein, partial [Gammaproteobacteria bacterium]|nr:ABC transporter ATP-binding protein [Gammaproteobacteria bacterium]
MSTSANQEAPQEPLIKIRDLHFTRGSQTIFAGVDMDIQRGQVTALMGPSGTGKTTLLRLITGQLTPDKGSVEVDGKNVADLSRAELYTLRRRMGMLFQNGALLTDLSVYDNVAFPLRENTELPESLIRQLVLMKLQAVGLRGAAWLMPSELSGGMARRVALARAIVMDPDIIFYDEPFAGLDPISMGAIVRLIKSLNQALGLTSIVVSHDVPEVSSVADYSYLISDGCIVGQGTPAQLTEQNSDWVQQFMQGKADGPVPFHIAAPDYRAQLLGQKAG